MNLTGKKVLHYLIQEKLGAGGMGVVYKANDTQLQRSVAIKFLHKQSPHQRQEELRFLREARAAARLDHQNICTVFQIGEAPEGAFIVMQYIPGQTLKDRIRQSPLSLDEAKSIAGQLANGLAVAHQAGIIHRDIKSVNIMVDDKNRLKIMDFGIAKMLEAEELTRQGSTLGTLAYMSPEQLRGQKVDFRSDIWSVGVVLYEVFTGQRPFSGQNFDLMNAIVQEAPPLPSDLRPELPAEVDALITKCLQKDRQDRFQAMGELIEMVEALPVVPKFVNPPAEQKTIARAAPSETAPMAVEEPLSADRQTGKRRSFSRLAVIIVLLIMAVSAGGWWYSTSTSLNDNRGQESAGSESSQSQVAIPEPSDAQLLPPALVDIIADVEKVQAAAAAVDANTHARNLMHFADSLQVLAQQSVKEGKYQIATSQFRVAQEKYQRALAIAEVKSMILQGANSN